MDKEIISAELVLTHRLFEWGTTMYVGKVSPDWNMDPISYNNAPDYNPDTDLITSVYYRFKHRFKLC